MSTPSQTNKAVSPSSVTVQIFRKVDTHAAEKVAPWFSIGQSIIINFPGYLGSGFIRTQPNSDLWVMIYRFDSPENLAFWEQSEERKLWSQRFKEHIQEEKAHKRTGVEGWFDSPIIDDDSHGIQATDNVDSFIEDRDGESHTNAPTAAEQESIIPPRWKQMIVIFCGFYPMTMTINILLSMLLPATTPLPVKVTLAVVIVMPLMVYLILPFLTQKFHPWLTKPRKKKPMH
ncbi:hypothetical protein EML15_00050 [Corynebacterium sp. sy017]|uniref:antibiotic biosynthesis monooxygenase n=1 Tax=unclassified Corynebacterium TaxID=2624378 RepID=UPI0011847C91|nr:MULTISPECIES: antibiotic biosynthesis monooxygenase [unclassified Corynebacterium]MBP3087546.1 hypothetical protein [Corynebacterium sp. sy017]TSD92124.1 hypothetical protein ELY17_00050 [Corynebacterium sp. SY003]